MRWTRRRAQAVTTWVVVVGWAVFYAVALATADQLPPPETAVVQLVVPPLLWVAAIRLVLRHWWSAAGSRMSAMDLPGTVARGRGGGAPRTAARVGEGDVRRAGRDPGAVGPVAVRAQQCRGHAAAATGGWLADARAHGRGGCGLGCGGRAGGRRGGARAEGVGGDLHRPGRCDGGPGRHPLAPAAAQYLPPPSAVYLAAVLAGCLWIALGSPRWLGTSRLAPHLGAAAAVVFAAWFWLAIRADGTEPPLPVVLLLAAVLVAAPLAAFFVPAFAAGRAGRSFRSGLQAAVWTVTAIMPLTYAIWLPEGLRRHAIDGHLLDGEVVAPVGANLPEALVFCLGIFPCLASRSG